MKIIINSVRFVLLIATVSFFASCAIHEEIHLNADESGEYQISVDVFESSKAALSSAAMMSAMFKVGFASEGEEMDSTAFLDEMQASITKMETEWWEDQIDKDSIGNVVAYLNSLPDSITSKPEFKEIDQKQLKDVVYVERFNKEEKMAKIGLRFPFKNSDEIPAKREEIRKFMELSGKSMQPGMDNLGSEGDSGSLDNEFSFKKKKLKGAFTSTMKNNAEKKDEPKDAMDEQFDSMMDGMHWRTTIHFPSEIKEVKGDYLYSQDAKSVEFRYPFMELDNEDGSYDYEVILK